MASQLQIENILRDLYSTRIKEVYVGLGKLKNTIRTQNAVKAANYFFPRMGVMTATPYVPLEYVKNENTKQYSTQVALNPYSTQNWLDPYQLEATGIDNLMGSYSDGHALAIARFFDSIILKSLDAPLVINNTILPRYALPQDCGFIAGNPADKVAVFLGDGTAPANPNTYTAGESKPLDSNGLLAMQAQLQENGVESDQDVYCVIDPKIKEQLMKDDRLVNIWYSGIDTQSRFQTGIIGEWAGIKFLVLGGRPEHRLPVVQFGTAPSATYGSRVYMYHKESTGLAIHDDINLTIERHQQNHNGWLVLATMRAGAVTIDPNGIVSAVVTDPSAKPE